MTDADRGVLGTPASRFQPRNRPYWDETVIHDLARGPRGAQDPWKITDSFAAGFALAENLVDVLFNTDAHRSIARRALRALYEDYEKTTASGATFRCGLADLTTYLQRDLDELRADLNAVRTSGGSGVLDLKHAIDDLQEVLARFSTGQQTPFLRLLLGRGTDPRPPLESTRRRTIYTLAGFKTPDHPDNPELWTQEDRNASAVMLAAISRMRRDNLHGRMEPNPVTGKMAIRPTASFIDEGYMVTALPVGRGYLAVNLRQGRSLRSLLVFMDQQSRGIQSIEAEARRSGAAEVNQFGSIYVFKQKSLGEAANAMTLLRSTADDPDGGHQETATLARKMLAEEAGGELRAGYCVMRDPDSRVATVIVDQVFGPLQRAAQTNATLKNIDWAVEMPTDPQDWDINPDALLQARRGVLHTTGQADQDLLETLEDDEDENQDWDSDPLELPAQARPRAQAGA